MRDTNNTFYFSALLYEKTTTPLCVRLLCLFCGFGIWEQLETYILIVIFVSLKNENQFPFVLRLQGQWIDRHRALKSLILQLLSSVSIVESLKVSSATWICHPKVESKIFHSVGVWSVSFMILWWSVIMRLIMIHIFYHTSWSFWAHVCVIVELPDATTKKMECGWWKSVTLEDEKWWFSAAAAEHSLAFSIKSSGRKLTRVFLP